jgi:sugar/nucleoside kinase (ribokinase family)
MSLLAVGSLAFDSIETPAGRRDHILGGSANYFSLAASLLRPLMLVGVVGDDFPESHVKALQERGVDTQGIDRRAGEKTFSWTGKYEGDMNEAETLEVHLNVFGDYLPNLPDAYKSADYVFLANGAPDTQKHVLAQLEQPKFVVADTMNLWIQTTKESLLDLLKRVDALILNDGEAKMLTGEASTLPAALKILEMGPTFVVCKKGEHGAILVGQDLSLSCPAYPLSTVVDPTGAGDSFAGGFMGYLALVDDLSPTSLKRAMKYGTVLSSYNCEDFGPDKLMSLSRADIERRLALFEEMMV